MADTGVDVRLGADVSGAKSSMEDAQRSIANSLAGIQKALQDFGAKNKQTTEQAIKNNADLSRTFMELKASATGGFNGIIGVIERFRGVWVSLAGILAGGFLWKSSVDEMLRFEDAVRGLTITFGMNTEAATHQAIALKLAGLSAETYEMMGQRVGLRLRMQSDEFDRLGVKTKDATGNLLPMNEILQNLFLRMQDFKAGTDQTEFALSTVGRNAKDFASDMLRLNSVTERATQLQRDLGIEMGPERIAQIEAYRIEQNAFSVVLGSIGDKIGEAVMPQLMNLARYFNEVGPSAAKFFVEVIKLVIATIDTLATGAKEDYLQVKAYWDNTVIAAQGLWSALKDIFSTGGLNVSNIWADMNKRILKNQLETNAAVLGMEADLLKRLADLDALRTKAGTSGAGPMRSGSERFTPRPKGGGGSDVAGFEESLKASENYYNNLKLQQGSFEVWSEAMTRDYWAEVLNFAMLNDKDREAITNKFYDAERKVQQESFNAQIAGLQTQAAAYKYNYDEKLRLAREAEAMIAQRYGAESKEAQEAARRVVEIEQQKQAQLDRLADLDRKRAESVANFEYAQRKTSLDQQLALRQINVQQQLAMERSYLSEKYDIDRAAIQAELDAMGPNDDPVKFAALKDKLLALELDYQTKKTAIDNAAALERAQFQLQADQAVENSFATLLDDLVTGTKTWKQAFSDAIKSITAELNKLAAQQFAKQIFGGGTAGGGMVDSLMASIFGGKGGGFDMGSILSGLGVPLFATGTAYVPQDTLAMVHKGEAIIPAQYNQRGALGQSFSVANHFNISGPIDTRTQDQIAAAAARGVHRAMQRNL